MTNYFCQFEIKPNEGTIIQLGSTGSHITQAGPTDSTEVIHAIPPIHGILKAFNLRCLDTSSHLAKCELWIGDILWGTFYPMLHGGAEDPDTHAVEFSFFDPRGFPIELLYREKFELFTTGFGKFELAVLTSPFRRPQPNFWDGRLISGRRYSILDGRSELSTLSNFAFDQRPYPDHQLHYADTESDYDSIASQEF